MEISMFQIDHLGIAVKSLAAAKAIYEKLGLSVSPEEIVEDEQVRLVMVPVGESRSMSSRRGAGAGAGPRRCRASTPQGPAECG